MTERFDVVVIGGGPAGLSAALNLVRARSRVLLLDGNRPRNAATLLAHGFLTRDGIPPLDLRRIGREEVAKYDEAEIQFALVESVVRVAEGFRVVASGVRGAPDRDVMADRVVVATGLTETLPAIDGMRAYYGTSLHSCFECDGYEKAGRRLAFIGESSDLAERAILATVWSDDIVVFTNGVGEVSAADESRLRERGIRVERRVVTGLLGDRDGLTGVQLDGGEVIECRAGFVRPLWEAQAAYLSALEPARDSQGLLVVDEAGRTSVEGLYAAGDITRPGPQQLVVAAGAGARVSAAIVRDAVGL